MSDSFSTAVGRWASQSEARITAVRRRAIELLAEDMTLTIPRGGRMPIDTGNMARSILASTQAMPNTSEGPFPGSNVGLVTSNLAAHTPLWLGLQAAYARRVNNGFVGADSLGRVYNQSGAHFVEGAIAEWPNLVRQAVTELRNSTETS